LLAPGNSVDFLAPAQATKSLAQAAPASGHSVSLWALKTVLARLTCSRKQEAGLGKYLSVVAALAPDMLGRLRRWLTFRRVLGIVAILILLLLVKGLVFDMGMGADLPILFSIDWGLAIEASALLIALSVRDHVITVAYVVKGWLSGHKAVNHLLRRVARRASRSRPTTPLLPPPPEDEPADWALSEVW
jgi:hypothetical protein